MSAFGILVPRMLASKFLRGKLPPNPGHEDFTMCLTNHFSADQVRSLLGLNVETGPVPEQRDGRVVFYYGGWDYFELVQSIKGKEHIEANTCIYRWKAKPGYYLLDMNVKKSNMYTRDPEKKIIEPDPAPIILMATAMVLLQIQGYDFGNTQYYCDASCDCTDDTGYGNPPRAYLAVRKGKIVMPFPTGDLRIATAEIV